MNNNSINRIRDRVATVAGAAIALLSGFGVISWDTTQTALVVAAVASGVMLIGSLAAHFKKGTTAEWVAVSMSLVAFIASGLTALNAINVLSLDESQIELVVGLLVAVLGIGGIPVVRSRTYPIEGISTPGGAADPVNPNV